VLAIPFPMIDPVVVSIQIGDFHPAIRWYSLAYVFGIMLGWWYISWSNKKDKFFGEDALEATLTWAVLGIILGGRIGYVLFYNPVYYATHIMEAFKVWEGGMSFHGGLLGVIIAFYLFSRKYKLPFLSVMDRLAIVTPIGLFLGRIANFINAELYGRKTDVPWGVIFPNTDGIPRHPSQLYEATLEGLILFAILFILVCYTKSLKKSGFVSGCFLIGYSVARLAVEFVREPDEGVSLLFDVITRGQLLSIPMVLVGLFLIYRARKQNELG